MHKDKLSCSWYPSVFEKWKEWEEFQLVMFMGSLSLPQAWLQIFECWGKLKMRS